MYSFIIILLHAVLVQTLRSLQMLVPLESWDLNKKLETCDATKAVSDLYKTVRTLFWNLTFSPPKLVWQVDSCYIHLRKSLWQDGKLVIANNIDSPSVCRFLLHYALVSEESSSTAAQSASAGLQPTTTVGTGAAAKAKQGMYDRYHQE